MNEQDVKRECAFVEKRDHDIFVHFQGKKDKFLTFHLLFSIGSYDTVFVGVLMRTQFEIY